MNQILKFQRATGRRLAFVAASVVCVLSMIGGAASAAVDKNVAITGAGATFPLNIIQQWAADAKNDPKMGFTVNYTGVGSGAGKTSFINNTVDFAGSDVPFSSAEDQQATASRGKYVYVVETGGGVSIMVNLAGVTSVKLSAPTIAKIFKGTITKWDHADITADNGIPLLPKDIVPVVRSDKSGTSSVFTEYLSKAAPSVWTTGSTGQFPVPANGVSKSGSDGVAGEVKARDGAVGYAELSFAVERQLVSASVKNASGAFVAPTSGSVTAAINDGTINPDSTVTMNYTTNVPSAYPISTVSYIIAPTSMDATKGSNLKAFLNYAVGSTGQSKAAPLHYAPLPKKLSDNSAIQIAKINPVSTAAADQAVDTGRVADPGTTTAAATTTAAPPAATTAAATTAPTARVLAAGPAADPTSSTTAAGTGGPDMLIGVAGVALVAAGGLLRRRARTS